jgi:hypothetical protein
MFDIRLPGGLLDRLGNMPWWSDLLAYRDEGRPLFVAARDMYLSVYVCGKAIFQRIEVRNGEIRATCDRRYFFGGDNGDLIFDGQNFRDERNNNPVVECLSYNDSSDLKRRVERIKRYPRVNLGDDELSEKKPDLSEKACLASRADRPEVINLEMALKGFESRNRNIAPRIDMVHLVRSEPGVAIVFTEAKLFSNTASLRIRGNAPAPVVTQVLDYQRYLDKNKDDIRCAYRKACKLLIQIRTAQKIKVDPLLEVVAKGAPLNLITQPRVLVFRTSEDSSMSSERWEPHRKKLFEHGIAVEVVDYP